MIGRSRRMADVDLCFTEVADDEIAVSLGYL